MSQATLAALRAGQLQGAQRLDLSCGLREFPREIFALADSLEVLNLSGNALSELPDDLHRLHRLRILFASDNAFTELPRALGACTQLEMVGFKANRISHVPAQSLPARLRWLILTDNAISALPEALGECTRLQKLMLAGNQLRTLPDALRRCQPLALLRLAANRFEDLPAWLPQMPNLAWLAVAGNPLTATHEWHAAANAPAASGVGTPAIAWSQLQLGEPLGEGASGVIYAAQWMREGGDACPVALKIFKSGVTSDGWPASEKAAMLQAGQHPQLIGLLGRLTQHPHGQDGLVLARVSPEWHNLAQPPSFASCTRDVYPSDSVFDADTTRRLARDVAAAMAHVHARGLVHGDLYAHNVLWRAPQADQPAAALLGDFGAAAAPPAAWLAALQQLDVRAYGWLLDELLERCTRTELRSALQPLRDQCLAASTARPLRFVEIESALAG